LHFFGALHQLCMHPEKLVQLVHIWMENGPK